jgi:hypothetical protein
VHDGIIADHGKEIERDRMPLAHALGDLDFRPNSVEANTHNGIRCEGTNGNVAYTRKVVMRYNHLTEAVLTLFPGTTGGVK